MAIAGIGVLWATFPVIVPAGVDVVVQVYIVPAISDFKVMVAALPLQMVWLAGVAVDTGKGKTVTVSVNGVPVQPFANGVMVYLTSAPAAVGLVSTSFIVPPLLSVKPVAVPDRSVAVHLKVLPGTVEVMA